MEKNFGTRVRQARHKAGLTQAALAEKLNRRDNDKVD